MFDDLNNFFLFFFGLFGLVGGIFGFTLYLSHRRIPMEKGLTPIYSERCGSPFASFPFVRVTLYDDFMVVKMWGADVFEYKNMLPVKRYGLFGGGIEVDTINTEKYGRAIIYSFNTTYLMNLLNEKIGKKQEHKSEFVFPPYDNNL